MAQLLLIVKILPTGVEVNLDELGSFDARYDGNILVNAMTVGVADADNIFYATASGIGLGGSWAERAPISAR